jgi:hypothetical protein
MSFSAEEDVTCPCGEVFEAALWGSVNATQNPELREEILAGQLNVVKCTMCGRMLYAEKFVLYHDPAAELMAFVYPKEYAGAAERWREKSAADFVAAQEPLAADKKLAYGPLTLFGMDSLVALLEAEREQEVQMEVFRTLAKGLDVEIYHLKPHLAREQGLPAYLPLERQRSRPIRERLQGGLRQLLAANDQLTLYRELSERLGQRGAPELNLIGAPC